MTMMIIFVNIGPICRSEGQGNAGRDRAEIMEKLKQQITKMLIHDDCVDDDDYDGFDNLYSDGKDGDIGVVDDYDHIFRPSGCLKVSAFWLFLEKL